MSVRQKSPSPGGLRSSRNRALEIGTEPSGFPPELPYENGVPAKDSGGSYKDNVDGGIPNPGAEINPSPFRAG